MGIVIVTGSGDAYHLQHLLRLLAGLILGEMGMVGGDNLLDLVADGHNRVQGGHGVLEDHRDLPAAELTHLPLRQL